MRDILELSHKPEAVMGVLVFALAVEDEQVQAQCPVIDDQMIRLALRLTVCNEVNPLQAINILRAIRFLLFRQE